jgi:hypothetical protein
MLSAKRLRALSSLSSLSWLRFALCCVVAAAAAGGCSDTTKEQAAAEEDDTGSRPLDTSETDADAEDASTGDSFDTAGGRVDVIEGCQGCASPSTCVDGWCVAPLACQPGQTDGCFNDGAAMVCGSTGLGFVPQPCFPNHVCAADECRPIVCDLGETVCDGDAATHACNSDRTGFLPSIPCEDGLLCTEGVCATSECRPDPKLGSYVGCVYWSTDLPVWPDPVIRPTNPRDLPYALVISNPNPLEAVIAFEPPPGVTINVADPVIPPLQTRVFEMPVLNVAGTGISLKGIGIGSNRPVLVHQFNPWEAVYSNDASLLLPETFFGREYVVLSWPTDPRGLLPTFPGLPVQENVNGFFSVLAPSNDTQVTFRVTARTKAGAGVQAMEANTSQTVTLQRGEVLNIEAEPNTLFEYADLTGSTVSASKPVAVFAGHESAAIGPEGGDSICCLDHLEEQMLPLQVLGTTYLAVKTKPRGVEPDVWRIVAAEDNVTLTTTPPQANANGAVLASRGDWVEVVTPDSFTLTTTGKVQVGQYLWSQQTTDDFTGDPSLILSVPAERFRDLYVLTVPQGYDDNWVTVVKPTAATVSVDGVALSGASFQTFGSGDYGYAYVPLTAGVHEVKGDAKFGLSAYGFNAAVSYGYPGGMTTADEP